MIQNFTKEDLNYIEKRGNDPEKVAEQLERFEKGFPFANIVRPATPDDGIIVFDEDQAMELEAEFDYAIKGKSIMKFVPASGAASRMFKDLFALSDNNIDEKKAQIAEKFLADLPRYPFYEDLRDSMKNAGLDIEKETKNGNYKLIIEYLLGEKGLNYGNLPKGLLKFHRYEDEIRTAVEEHFVEAGLYASDGEKVQLHFTVSEQHKQLFNDYIRENIIEKYQSRFGVKYNITFSLQDTSTDTPAATEENEPFRDENGNILFRPAGHGALIHNLNKYCDADIIFVKNIDNVTRENLLEPTVRYKKILAAYLLQLQSIQFQYLKMLQDGNVDPMTMCEIMDFAETKLMVSLDEQVSEEELFDLLNRPIRICGMVKNEGEPGGGPFFVKDQETERETLQIVESSQIDKNDPEKVAVMQKSTHFNPVDMVCGIKDFNGEKFDLLEFIAPETGFISSKSYNGKTLKAMELPGLWNGSMANWITIFAEVPLATFNPVKTVFDLLKRN